MSLKDCKLGIFSTPPLFTCLVVGARSLNLARSPGAVPVFAQRRLPGPEAPMTLAEPFMVGPPTNRSRPWRVVVGPDEANGMALGDGRIPPHAAGPGRHVHTNEDEGIYVVSGVLTIEVGERWFEAGPECFVWMPRGVPHTFANLSDEEVRTVGLLNPTGLEEMFREQAAYFASLQGPPDVDALIELSARYGVYPVDGPPLQHSR